MMIIIIIKYVVLVEVSDGGYQINWYQKNRDSCFCSGEIFPETVVIINL